jgi:rhamnosyltransferase
VPKLARYTAAVLVVYHPDSDPAAVLAKLRGSVALTVVADNSERGHLGLSQAATSPTCIRLHTRNEGGLAGAYNRAIEHLAAEHPRITHVVFLDEDSDVSGLGRLLAETPVIELLNRPDTAAVAPAYVDRATGLRGKYIELRRWRLRYLPRVFQGLRQVAFVINSMSVWRMDALRRIGPFNEGLEVDHVDTEYCLRARQAGLRVHVHGSHEFLHSIGARRRFTVFGREMQAGGHAPSRRYLIGRNTAWLCRRYVWHEPAFAFLCLSRLAYEALGIGLAEDRRLAKLWALLRGSLVGIFTPRLR